MILLCAHSLSNVTNKVKHCCGGFLFFCCLFLVVFFVYGEFVWFRSFFTSNISLLEAIVSTAAYQFRNTCPWQLSYVSCDKMHSNLILSAFLSPYVPNVTVCVIPDCWALTELGKMLPAVLVCAVFRLNVISQSLQIAPSLFYLCFIQVKISAMVWHAWGYESHARGFSLSMNFCSA